MDDFPAVRPVPTFSTYRKPRAPVATEPEPEPAPTYYVPPWKKGAKKPPPPPHDFSSWTAEACLEREKNEVDDVVYPYTFSRPVELATETDQVVFLEDKHEYFVKAKNDKKQYYQVALSGSKLWHYYNSQAFSSDFGSSPEYVAKIRMTLPTLLVYYFVHVYESHSDHLFTNSERRQIFESSILPRVEPTTLKPMQLIGGGVFDVVDTWLLSGNNADRPAVYEPDGDKHLHQLFFFLHLCVSQTTLEYLQKRCEPLYDLLMIYSQSFLYMCEQRKKIVTPLMIAAKIGRHASETGTCLHTYVERRLKSQLVIPSTKLSSEHIANAEKFIADCAEFFGTYRNDLSEVPIIINRHNICSKSDFVFDNGKGVLTIADLKVSDKLWMEAEKHGLVKNARGWIMMENKSLFKSSSLWEFAFQLSTYRKTFKMMGYQVNHWIFLVIVSPEREGYLIVGIDLATVTTKKDPKESFYSVLQHNDRAFTFRLRMLKQMQAQFDATGIPVIEEEFMAKRRVG